MAIAELMQELTSDDCNLILDCLDYTRHKLEDYAGYPSYEYRRQHLDYVRQVAEKVRALRDIVKEKKVCR